MSKRFGKWEHPEFDEVGMTLWNWKCQHHENLSLGKHVDIGAFSYINAKNDVIIEDNVQIGSHCSIYSISTIDNKEGPVVLKRNSRVGSHSLILPNVVVGVNSIIGAFSLVNKDIPSNVMAFGVPAIVIRELNDQDKDKFFKE